MRGQQFAKEHKVVVHHNTMSFMVPLERQQSDRVHVVEAALVDIHH